MGLKRIKVKKAETLNWRTNKGRIQTIKNFYYSEKFERLSTEKKVLLEKSIYQISKWQRARKKSTKKTYRKQIEKSFIKLFDIKFDKKQNKWLQKDHSVGWFKNLAGVSGIEIETTRFERIAERMGYNMINDFKEFAAIYDYKIKPKLEEMGVIAYFDNFIGDTDSGWTRRVMTKLGIADTLSREQFYEWLKILEQRKQETK